MFVRAPASIDLESGIFSPNSLSSATTIIYYSSDLLRCWCTGTTHYNAQFRTAGKARPFSTPPIGRRSCQLLEVLRGECVAGDMAARSIHAPGSALASCGMPGGRRSVPASIRPPQCAHGKIRGRPSRDTIRRMTDEPSELCNMALRHPAGNNDP